MPEKWSFSVGPHGYTARVFERVWGGPIYLRTGNPSGEGRIKTCQEFPVRDAEGKLIPEAVKEAKKIALAASNSLIRGQSPHRDPLTVGELFDPFRREEVADMKGRHRKETLRELELLERFLGPGSKVEEIGPREWNAIKRARASGEIDARGHKIPPTAPCPTCGEVSDPKCTRCDGSGQINPRRSVRDRTVAKTLKVLRQACRFGEEWRAGSSEPLLERDPTRGLDMPREKDPNQPVCSDGLLKALLKVAPTVQMGHGKKENRERSYLQELLVIAAQTGARIGAVVALRWSDWNPEGASFGTLRWRAEHDKGGRTRVTPVTRRVRETLENLRQRKPGVGEAWMFPAPESDGHVRVDVALRWWREAEKLAEVEHEKGMGFHALRRRFANKLKDHSPVDVAALTGHKDVSTLQEVYQRSDAETQDRILQEAFGEAK